MLSGWVLHLVQVADGAVCFVFVLLQEGKVSTEKLGQGLVFVWVCYGPFCVFQGCTFKMLFGSLFAKCQAVSVV